MNNRGFIDEIRDRGLVHSITPETEEYLNTHPVKGYVGFDPTADSLHIGNLLPLMMLVYLQKHGHTPYALVGGATGMVGDPSGKDAERPILSEEILRHNQQCIHQQLERFLDFRAATNAARIVNNYDWFKNISFLSFLREVGKYITINYMKAKDSVKKRLESEQGISYTEFAYQLVQGYDFQWLYEQEGVQLQMGGADQWGNITTGSYLIGKAHADAHVFAVTCPLLTKSDGTKFGKTAAGENIWLDARRTSPYRFYQFWLNVEDGEAEKCMLIFSPREVGEIQTHIAAHRENPGARTLHKLLAEDITTLVHGADALKQAQEMTAFFFGAQISREMLMAMSEAQWQETVQNAADIKTIATADFADGMNILDALVHVGVAQSRGEAKRFLLQDKSILLNGDRCEAMDYTISKQDLFFGQYLILQKGKKNKYLVRVGE